MKRSISLIATLAVLALATTAFATFPSSPTLANQAKVEILSGKIRVGDTFKMVLKTQSGASGDTAAIGSYSTTGELATSGGYTQGGVSLSGCAVSLSSSTANFTCSAASWTNTAALTFDAVEIYDSSCGTNSCTNNNQVIALYPITSFTSSSSGTFTVTLPGGAISLALMDVLEGNNMALLDLAVKGNGSIALSSVSIEGSGGKDFLEVSRQK
jgi:hypothetical protein